MFAFWILVVERRAGQKSAGERTKIETTEKGSCGGENADDLFSRQICIALPLLLQ